MLEFLKYTKTKLKIAGYLYKALKLLGFNDIQKIKRHGIHFEVDLREGIDLSLFLFGSFQNHVWNNKSFKLADNPILFDVGANVGSISFFLAKTFKDSKVYAFEPTHFAYMKFLRNLDLNPDLKPRIFPIQTFISADSGKSERVAAYSSWRIDGAKMEHPIHGGIEQLAAEKKISLDQFIIEQKISRVDFIKIDVDGFELDVLGGAKKILKDFRPIVIFEFMGHTTDDVEKEIQKYLNLFTDLKYRLYNSQNKEEIELSKIHSQVPRYGGIDILCIPYQ